MTNRQPLCIAAGSGIYDRIDFLRKLIQDPLVRDLNGITIQHMQL